MTAILARVPLSMEEYISDIPSGLFDVEEALIQQRGSKEVSKFVYLSNSVIVFYSGCIQWDGQDWSCSVS